MSDWLSGLLGGGDDDSSSLGLPPSSTTLPQRFGNGQPPLAPTLLPLIAASGAPAFDWLRDTTPPGSLASAPYISAPSSGSMPSSLQGGLARLSSGYGLLSGAPKPDETDASPASGLLTPDPPMTGLLGPDPSVAPPPIGGLLASSPPQQPPAQGLVGEGTGSWNIATPSPWSRLAAILNTPAGRGQGLAEIGGASADNAPGAAVLAASPLPDQIAQGDQGRPLWFEGKNAQGAGVWMNPAFQASGPDDPNLMTDEVVVPGHPAPAGSPAQGSIHPIPGSALIHGALTAGSFLPSWAGSGFSALDGILAAHEHDYGTAAIDAAAAVGGLVSDAGAIKAGLEGARIAAKAVEAAKVAAEATEEVKAAEIAGRASTIQANKIAGDQWETEAMHNVLPPSQGTLQPQVTIKSNGPSGLKARLDAVGTDLESGQTKLSDMKASQTAPFTPNQTVVYPELETHGGVVVGKGKAPYVGGTQIPPTKVDIIRKPEQ